MEEKTLSKITELSDAELDSEKLDEAWKILGSRFLSEDLASSIGYLATFWSTLEHILVITIHEIHKLKEPTASILTIETSFLQRIAIIKSSISLSRHEGLFDEWCEIETQLNALRIARNDIIHGMWLPFDGSVVLHRLSARGKLKIETSKPSTRDVRKTVVTILKMLKKLIKFHGKCEKEDLVAMMRQSNDSLDRTQSPKARAQDQARTQKKASRHPPHGPKPVGPKLSSAQKRALREAENNDEKPETQT